MTQLNNRVVLCDTHAHLHAGCDIPLSWNAAYRNLSRFSAGKDFSAVVFLADMEGQSFFEDLHASIGSQIGSTWSVSATEEAVSVKLTRDDGASIYVVAGAQVVSLERVEVLMLGTRTRLRDGVSLSDVLQGSGDRKGWTVLPWGVGKWIGKRGALVASAFGASPGSAGVWACDNGNRPWFWPEPELIGRQRKLGVPVFRGTDPLRIPGDTLRIGSFGNRIVCDFDPERPFGSVDKAIRSGAFEMGATGSCQGLVRFVANQIRLRLS
ncbi:MAG: hypothetical protein PHF70_10390 [Opitutales bacterium]|nr:hypothetical protein [Opitutales bacterium]